MKHNLQKIMKIAYTTRGRLYPVSQIACVLLLTLPGCHGDVCVDSNTLAGALHKHSTPKGGVHAGIYNKVPSAHTLPKCLLSCCRARNCNTVFLHNDICYLIQCNTTVSDACDAQTRVGEKFLNTFMINVRSIEETSLKSAVSTSPQGGPGTSTNSVVTQNNCSPATTAADCGPNASCDLQLQDNFVGYQCKCVKGYTRNIQSNRCDRTATTTTVAPSSLTPQPTRSADTTCTYGLLEDCGINEFCEPKNSRSRQGFCKCVKGYMKNSLTGWCESILAPLISNSTNSTGTTIPLNKVEDNNKTQTSTQVTSTTHSTLQPIVVSAGNNPQIQLPVNEVTLAAYTLEKPKKKDEFKYQWSLILHPEGSQIGEMDGINTASLKLSKLVAGLYTFKIAVSAAGRYGEAFVNVTVLKPARQNQAPVAVIKPTQQKVVQPNNMVLDGSGSTDDDKIIKYHWELVSGPLRSHKTTTDMDRAMLNIPNLAPGKYIFKLTVTDSDGVTNATDANVEVIKEKDYPPKADAGPNVIISLPQNSVKLYGNASKDDKGIKSYEWIKKSDDKLTADMTGVRTPVLSLEHLEVGDYTFTLKVKDTAGQVSTADVRVFVRPEHNRPPVAQAGRNQVVFQPTDSTILDGSNSTDDQKIAKYQWTQESGPSSAKLDNGDRAIATVHKLVLGTYQFRLTVTDNENLQGSSTVTVTVKENQNKPPIANAGGDQIIYLPRTLITVDGSKSSDDKRIVAYQWTRDAKSLATGEIINGSDHQAVLQLADVVSGRYVFTLKVFDAEGRSSTDTASIIVKPDQQEKNLVELLLDTDVGSFTEAHKATLKNQLALLLHKTSVEGATNIHVRKIEQDRQTGHLRLVFFVTTDMKDIHSVRQGTEVLSTLKKKFTAESDVLDFPVVKVDTVLCQKNCSGHGHCDQYSKQCICDAFWMVNIFGLYLTNMESNCDWSILYVIIIAFLVVVSLVGSSWGLVCLLRRWCKWRPKKRHRYMLLEDAHDKDNRELDRIPRGNMGKLQSSSLMVSESDFSSDEETLFINHRKKTNGHGPINGLVKPPKTMIKT